MSALRSEQAVLGWLDEGTAELVVEQAEKVLAEIGIRLEYPPALERLRGAGAGLEKGRVRISPEMVKKALSTVPATVSLFDRTGKVETRLGAGAGAFVPGSTALLVLEPGSSQARPARTADCRDFARVTEVLPHFGAQSTCVVPSDVPPDAADRKRLALALEHCGKPVVTGVFGGESFERMRKMLIAVRGDEAALRDKPLAVFDCCPVAPLTWDALGAETLMRCAEHGLVATIVSVPMTGATAPVTLFGALVQHTAENLAGVVLHQLARPSAPVLYGACPTAFDMRHGTSPIGAIESAMLNAAASQIGRRLGLPTHGYLGLSDAKVCDYQAGLESGVGALTAALGGVDLTAGAGMLELAGCQSLEKLVLDHEAIGMARRAARGIEVLEEPSTILEVLRECSESGQFLSAAHTRRWFRKELHFPGRSIDRRVRAAWAEDGALQAAARARSELEMLLSKEAESLDPGVLRELGSLAS